MTSAREPPATQADDGLFDGFVQRESPALVRRSVVAAPHTLPARQRAVVVLRYLDDRTETQTAAALGCSVGTVKSQSVSAPELRQP